MSGPLLPLLLAAALAAASPQPAAPVWTELDEAHAAINRGDIDGAIQLYTRIIESGAPASAATAYSFRGFAYLLKAESVRGEAATAEYGRAIADAGAAIERNPQDIRAHFVRGSSFAYTRKYDEAIADLDVMIGLDPGMPEAYVARGFAYNGKRDYDRAIENFSEAIKRRPFYAEPYKLRGIAHGYKAEYAEALADFGDAIKYNPSDIQNYFDRGIVYADKGDDTKAIADFTIVVNAQPDYAPAYDARGRVRQSAGDYDAAIADFNRTLALKPGNAEAYYHRALAYGRRGDYEKAVADFSQAIKIKPGLYDAYFARGRSYLYAGRFQAAAADIERSLSIVPGGPYRAIWLYIARVKGGKDGKAELARNAQAAGTGTWPGPIIALFLGEADAGQLKAAAQSADNAGTRERRGCQAAFYLGESALLRGADGEARGLLETARDTCPRFFLEHEGAEAELRALK